MQTAKSVVERIKEEAAQDGAAARGDGGGNRGGRAGPRAEDPPWDPSAAFSTRNAPMLRCIPRYCASSIRRVHCDSEIGCHACVEMYAAVQSLVVELV